VSAACRLGGDRFRDKGQSYRAIRYLEQSGGVAPSVVSLLRDLRGLRNQAAHAPEFALSTTSAMEYASAAAGVAAHLWTLGSSTDTEAPRLLAFAMPSPKAHMGQGAAQVELRAHLVDDLSGVADSSYSGSPTQIRFRSPSRGQFVDALFVVGEHLVDGTPHDGSYCTFVSLPQFAETGAWRVEYFLLVDQCGNSSILTAEQMDDQGFPTTIEVHP